MENRYGPLAASIIIVLAVFVLNLILLPLPTVVNWIVAFMVATLVATAIVLIWDAGFRSVPADPRHYGLLEFGSRRSQFDGNGREYAVSFGEQEESSYKRILPEWVFPIFATGTTPGRMVPPGPYWIFFWMSNLKVYQVTVQDLDFSTFFPTRDKLNTKVKISVDWRPDFFTYKRKQAEDGSYYRVYYNLYNFLDRRVNGASEEERNEPIEKKLVDVLMDATRSIMSRYNLVELLAVPEVILQSEFLLALSRPVRGGPRYKLEKFSRMAQMLERTFFIDKEVAERERALKYLGTYLVRGASSPKGEDEIGADGVTRRGRLEEQLLAFCQEEALIIQEAREDSGVPDLNEVTSAGEIEEAAIALREEISEVGISERHMNAVLIHLANLANIDLPDEVEKEFAQLTESVMGIIALIERMVAAGQIDVNKLEGIRLEEITSTEGIEELARRGVNVSWEDQKTGMDFRSILQGQGEVFRPSGVENFDLLSLMRMFKKLDDDGGEDDE